MTSAVDLIGWVPRDPFDPPGPSPNGDEEALAAGLAEAMGAPPPPSRAAIERARETRAAERAARDAQFLQEFAEAYKQRPGEKFETWRARYRACIERRDRAMAEESRRRDEELARLYAPLPPTKPAPEGRKILEKGLKAQPILDVKTFPHPICRNQEVVYILIKGQLYKTPFALDPEDGKSPKWPLRTGEGIKVVKVSPIGQDNYYQLILPTPPDCQRSGPSPWYIFEFVPCVDHCTRICQCLTYREVQELQVQGKLTVKHPSEEWLPDDQLIVLERFTEEEGISFLLYDHKRETITPCSMPFLEEKPSVDDFEVI